MSEIEQAGLIGVVTAGSLAVLNWFLRRSDSRDSDAVSIRTYQQQEIHELQARLDVLEQVLDGERTARRTAEDKAYEQIAALTRQVRVLETQLGEEQARSRVYEDENSRLRARIGVLETQLGRYGFTGWGDPGSEGQS